MTPFDVWLDLYRRSLELTLAGVREGGDLGLRAVGGASGASTAWSRGWSAGAPWWSSASTWGGGGTLPTTGWAWLAGMPQSPSDPFSAWLSMASAWGHALSGWMSMLEAGRAMGVHPLSLGPAGLGVTHPGLGGWSWPPTTAPWWMPASGGLPGSPLAAMTAPWQQWSEQVWRAWAAAWRPAMAGGGPETWLWSSHWPLRYILH